MKTEYPEIAETLGLRECEACHVHTFTLHSLEHSTKLVCDDCKRDLS